MDGRRVRVNQTKVREGKSEILSQLNNVEGRCNSKMTLDLTKSDEVGFMDCTADLYDAGSASLGSGSYNAGNSTHAEMNALAAYIVGKTDFTAVSKITISAPPCKSCAFVLELLGLIGKVQTTKNIYKHATGSWQWPDMLKTITAFDSTRWNTIKNKFAGSGWSEQDILNAVIDIVQTRPSSV